MNRVDRLAAILLLLQGGRRTAGELAQRFEISRRTIFRDIQALCEMGVPVLTETGARGGYELMPDYTLAPLQLTHNEALLLRLALTSISQLADTPFRQERETLLAKMQAVIPQQRQRETEPLLETIRLDVPERAYTAPFLERLLASASKEEWLRVSYRSERGVSQQTLLPRRLYATSGFWYCDAYSLERLAERTYRVDRLLSLSAAVLSADEEEQVRALPEPPLPYTHESFPEVCIRLSERGVLVMERDPHLGNAIEPHPEGGGLLCFRCPPSEYDWLVRTMLNLGPDAELLGPPVLRQQIHAAALAVVQLYAEPEGPSLLNC